MINWLNNVPKTRRFFIVLTFCWFFISAHIYVVMSSPDFPQPMVGMVVLLNASIIFSWGLWWVFKE